MLELNSGFSSPCRQRLAAILGANSIEMALACRRPSSSAGCISRTVSRGDLGICEFKRRTATATAAAGKKEREREKRTGKFALAP